MSLARMAVGETMRAPEIAKAAQEEIDKGSVFNDFMTAARDDDAIVADDIQEASSQFLALVKSRAFWPYVISGGRVSAENMETIVQNSVDTFMARFASSG